MNQMTTPESGQPWVYQVPLSTNSHTVVFNTENKFLDRNIKAKISVNAGSVSPLFSNTNIGTYFNSGTSSSNSISITPKATTTNGYIAVYDSDHAVTGDTAYYTIKTTSLSFSGGALNNKAASADKANITWNTDTDNGIYVQTKGTAGRAAVTYTNANAGWLAAHTSATNASSAVSTSTWNGTKYYITAINVPKDIPFTITTTADTALDTTSDLTITNAEFRRIVATNEGTIYARQATSGKGNVYVKAYGDSGDTQVINNGAWVAPSVTAGGTYYGKVVVASATPTTSYSNTGMSTYFNAGTSSSNNVTITPQYTNTAGFVTAHTDTNNGGVGYWKIKTTSVVNTNNTTVSGTAATRATATWGTGWITSGSIAAATFANTATSGTTYVDISNTTSAPVLTSGDYLYVNRGYVDNLKISLAKLVPDTITGKTMAPANYILMGYAAFDGNGAAINGTMQSYTGEYTVI